MLGSKPIAALTGGLLARKGQARPAMRPQIAPAHPHDDLGWNDMGDPVGSEAVAQPAPPPALPMPPVLPVPQVLVDRAHLAIGLDVAAAELPRGRRAAFTLRLDADRHLSLRLAAAVSGRSAQQIVTEALDAFIATLPEVSALREQMLADGRSIVRGN